jgi:nucleoside-diphosphate-sugar epimerase
MHVFVSGATGFVGLHTVLALRKAGHQVRLGVRNRQKMTALYAAHGVPIDDYSVADITDADALKRALHGVDAVVHTAALVSTDPAQAQRMHDTNVIGTRNVMTQALQQEVASIVYVSSAAALFDPALAAIDESTPIAAASSPYARSKIEADHFVRNLIDQGANIAITYPTGVMGPQDPALSEGNQSLLFILNNFHIHTSSGLQIIDVRDLAAAQVRLLEGAHRGGFVIAGHYCPWREFGELIERLSARRLLKLPIPGPLLRGIGSAIDALNSVYAINTPITREAMEFATRWVVCNDQKIRDTLNIEYRPLQDTVRDTTHWLAANGHVSARWVSAMSATP